MAGKLTRRALCRQLCDYLKSILLSSNNVHHFVGAIAKLPTIENLTIQLLKAFVRTKGCDYIIVTHSPFSPDFLKSLTPLSQSSFPIFFGSSAHINPFCWCVDASV